MPISNGQGTAHDASSKPRVGRVRLVARTFVLTSLFCVLAPRVWAKVDRNGVYSDNPRFILHHVSLQVTVIMTTMLLSAYLTGLNIGLLSLDKYETMLMIYNGSPAEKFYSGKVLNFLIKKHHSLLTIVLFKTFIEAIFTLLLDNLIGEYLSAEAAILTTAIVTSLTLLIFGEIIPQSLALRYGLVYSAKTVHFFRLLWFIVFPITYPMSLLLVCILGEDKPKSSNQIVMLSHNLEKIICNANEKHVALALEGLCIKNKVKYFILTDFFEKQLTSYPDEEKPLNSTNSNSRLTINTTGGKLTYSSSENYILGFELKTPNVIFKENPVVQTSILSIQKKPWRNFIVAHMNSDVSKILSMMISRNVELCIVFGKAIFSEKVIIRGYLVKQDLIDDILKISARNESQMCESILNNSAVKDRRDSGTLKSMSKTSTGQQQFSDVCMECQTISEPSNQIMCNMIKPLFDALRVNYKHFVGPECKNIDETKLINYLKFHPNIHKQMISINNTQCTDASTMLISGRQYDIVLINVKGYLPVSMKFESNEQTMLLQPNTLLGCELIKELQKNPQNIDDCYYTPNITINYPQGSAFCVYWVLNRQQVLDILSII